MDGTQVGRPSPPGGAFAFARAVRRRRIRDSVVFNLCLFAAGVIAYLHFSSPPPAISTETYQQIQMGMTWRQVHEVVRAMPGGYGPTLNPDYQDRRTSDRAAVRFDSWGSRDGVLRVGYDADGRVCEKSIMQPEPGVADHPELWSWWKRQRNRRVPDPAPAVAWTHF